MRYTLVHFSSYVVNNFIYINYTRGRRDEYFLKKNHCLI